MNDENKTQKILGELSSKLKGLYGNTLDRIILYGSYARNDYSDESDIDIMVIVGGGDDEIKKSEKDLNFIESRMSLNYDVTLSVFVRSSEHFDRWKDSMPFYRNIVKEGVEIYE